MIDLIQVQKLIYDRISTLEYPIVDEFTLYEETEPPFIQLGSLYINDNNTKNSEGMVVQQYINIYSAYAGKKEILEISQAVSNIMKNNMVYEGYTIYIKEDRKTIILDMDKNDNRFYHAVLIFNLHIN